MRNRNYEVTAAAVDAWSNPPASKSETPSEQAGGFNGEMKAISAHSTERPSLKKAAEARMAAGATNQARQASDGVILRRGSDLEIVPIDWLWPGWLARGKMHLLAGAPGQGKTTIALAFASTVSTGGHWPDGTRCHQGNVLIYSGEDDPADTLAPRLIAAGADLSRCHFVEAVRIDGEQQPFDPSRDMVSLATAIDGIGGVDLVIVDPIAGVIRGDSHKNSETRRDLQPLADLATACRCALIGISHFSKAGQGIDPAQRVIGSVAFTAVARVVMVAAKVKSEGDQPLRVLARAKSNIGSDDGGFEYSIEQAEAAAGIHASRIAWGDAVVGTARDLLTDPGAVCDVGSATDEAAELLKAELVADCWTPSEVARKPLKEAGFSKKQIYDATNRLGIVRKKGGMKAGWYWRLPGGSDPEPPTEDSAEDSEDSEDSSLRKVESSKESSAALNLANPPKVPEGSNLKNRESSESSGVHGIFGLKPSDDCEVL